MTVDSKQIREITPEGITYIEADGTEKFVDFMECFNTYVKRSLASPTTPPWMADYVRRAREIGEITFWDNDDIENGFLVGFFDNGVTYVSFSDWDTVQAFNQKIIEAGWNLFDGTD